MRDEVNAQLQVVRHEMATGKNDMISALQHQNAEMAVLIQRANAYEAQSLSARAELETVRQQMKRRDIEATTLELLTIPATDPHLQLPRLQSPACSSL